MFGVRGFDDAAIPRIRAPDSEENESGEADSPFLDEVNALYADDKIFEAADVLDRWMEAEPNVPQQYPIYHTVQADRADCIKFLELANSNDGWVRDSSSNKSIQTWYRVLPGTRTVTVRVQGIMHAPIMNVLSLFNESDLFHKWVPMVSESEPLGQPSRCKQVVRQVYSVPIPFFSDRETFCLGYAVNALNTEHKQILAIGRSVYGERFGSVPLTKPKRGNV
jgi:hypothetical protein